MITKMSYFLSGWIFFACAASIQISGQSTRSANFSSPLDIPLLLSGNYGEIRSAHFHAGIDIKTQQVEGKNVYAVENGQVVRINVQSGGYGNAVYLAHPGGFVSVYAHLKDFMPEIEEYVRENQYQRQSFEVNLFPEANRFTYKKGQLIGYSGNSGNSSGPHLHFEIRDQNTSIPLNVLNFDFPVRDDISPKILWLAVYPLGENSTVNGNREKMIIPVTTQNEHHILDFEDVLEVSGEIGFGIETYDFLNGAANLCSPYTTSFSIDDHTVCFYRLDSIPFNMTSYVNSHIDYEEKLKSGRVIQKLFVDPNNGLEIYKTEANRGICNFIDTVQHHAEISVSDVYGNESLLTFDLISVPVRKTPEHLQVDSTIVSTFHYGSLNVYENNDIRVVAPEGALYNDIFFRYEMAVSEQLSISDTFKVHDEYTPLHKSYVLSIRPKNLPDGLRDKVMIASMDKNGDMISHGGEYSNGFVTAQLNSFGRFFLAVDTVSPEITAVNFTRDRQYADGQIISFKITDMESGIRKYNGYIDGKWTLFEYDAKNDLILCEIDKDHIENSITHQLEIILTDQKNNVSHFRSTFFY